MKKTDNGLDIRWDEFILDYMTDDLTGFKPVVVANAPNVIELQSALNRRILVFLFLPSLVLFCSLIWLAIDMRQCVRHYCSKMSAKCRRRTSMMKNIGTTMNAPMSEYFRNRNSTLQI